MVRFPGRGRAASRHWTEPGAEATLLSGPRLSPPLPDSVSTTTSRAPSAGRPRSLDPHASAHEPARAQREALRVLQAGAVAGVLAASAYRAFELDRFFVPKELVLHLTAAAAGVLCLGAARRARAGRVDVLLALFVALGAASAAFAANPWAAGRALAIGASGVVIFWSARALARAGLGGPLLAGLALAVAVGAATSLAQAYGARSDFFSLNRAPGGTLGNRNSVAHLCAFGLPLLLACGLRARRFTGVLASGTGVAAVAAVLVLTRSRAAWLAAMAVMLVLLVGWMVAPAVRRHARSWARLFVLLALAGGGVAAALLLPNTLKWRSENPYAETAQGVVNYREGSGRGRLIQYRNTLAMALADPVLGVGPGNWPVAYPRHAAPGDPSLDGRQPGTTSNPWPSSDWVAFVAERGVPAFALLATVFVGLGLTALRRLRQAREADEALAALALAALLAGVAVAGAFDAVLLLALPSLLVWAALGALSAGDGDARSIALPVFARLAGIVVLLAMGAAFAARSAGQLAAMALFDGARTARAMERAAMLDPGSYRIHLRLAREGATRESRCEHARAAHALFPEAAAAKALARRCGG